MISTISALSLGLLSPAHLADRLQVVNVTPPGVLMDAREPQVAVASSGKVFVTYGAGNAVYCSTSSDSGRTYGPPIKVAEAGVLSLGMRRGPRIAVAGDSVVITAIYGRQGRGRDGDLLAWRSSDNGKSWRGPVMVTDSPGAAREGLHGMAGSNDGSVACAWLDLRNGKTELFSSVSRDGGTTWRSNKLIYKSPDGSVCECCHPSVAYDTKGTLYVMWRNSLAGSRDMYLCRS